MNKLIPVLLLAAVLAVLPLVGCNSTLPNRDPLGERFPSVRGESLTGEERALPESLAGAPALLLVGYEQKAQFDADRWLYGLLQSQLALPIIEVPTIPGLFPSLFAGTIDEGMRKGIPSEDWASVVTVYGSEASPIVAFTRDENGRNIRVLLLDGEGIVRWFHDRGFSAGKLIELEGVARKMGDGAP